MRARESVLDVVHIMSKLKLKPPSLYFKEGEKRITNVTTYFILAS